MSWRVQQLTNAWHNVYAFDVRFAGDDVEHTLYDLATRNPYTSFRAVDEAGNLYRDLPVYRVTP